VCAPLEGWGALDQRINRIQKKIFEVNEMKNTNLALLKNDDAGHTNFGMLDKIFEFGDVKIRVELDEAGEPWFVANDICKALGLRNSRQAIEHHTDPEDVHQMDTLTKGGKQKVNFVNEKGLYGLVFGSEKKRARAFKNWVFSEVLPAIRQHGMYLSEEKFRQLDAMQEAFDQLRKEMEQMASRKKASLPKKDYMRNLITACKHVDMESGQALEFAGVQKIRSSKMTEKEKRLWQIQHLSRTGCGQMKKILKVLVGEGCVDADSYKVIAKAIKAVEKLRSHFCHDEMIQKTIEIRDHDLNEKPRVLISCLEEKAMARALLPAEVGGLPRPMAL